MIHFDRSTQKSQEIDKIHNYLFFNVLDLVT